jgi:LacI family transcriptional regulator
MKQRPSLVDLVRKTGFSHGTISRALNGRYGVNAETREKILKVAREIGYSANSSARSFKTGKTGRWGLLLPNLLNPYYAELLEYLDGHIRDRQQIPYSALSHTSVEKEREILRQWSAGEVDAVIVDFPVETENQRLLVTLQSWDIPVFTLHTNGTEKFDSLTYDYRQPQERALHYLLELGHRSIGFVGYASPDSRSSRYFQDYANFMRRQDLPIRPRDLLFIAPGQEAGREMWLHWLTPADRPTALVCFDDSIALSIISQCQARRVRIPDDLSLLGRDGVQLSACVGLSTLQTNRAEAAGKIVKAVQDRLQEPSRPIENLVLPAELIMRTSVGRAPVART